MSSTKRVNTLVSTVSPINIEWNAALNKLRVADTTTDKTIAVFSNDAIYALLPSTPPGQVIVRNSERLPDLVDALERQGIIRIIERRLDTWNRACATAEVLIP